MLTNAVGRPSWLEKLCRHPGSLATSLAGILILLGGMSGCGQASNAFNPDAAFAGRVLQRAEQLAKSEMARFQKMEEMYKDTVVLNEMPPNEMHFMAVYYKSYRRYTGAKVEDISRQDSLIKPIVCKIRFSYDLMGTQPRPIDMESPREVAMRDTEYELLKKRHVTMTYYFDIEGNYREASMEAPPPDSIYFPEDDLMKNYELGLRVRSSPDVG